MKGYGFDRDWGFGHRVIELSDGKILE